jgi:hypothetical protein
LSWPRRAAVGRFNLGDGRPRRPHCPRRAFAATERGGGIAAVVADPVATSPIKYTRFGPNRSKRMHCWAVTRGVVNLGERLGVTQPAANVSGAACRPGCQTSPPYLELEQSTKGHCAGCRPERVGFGQSPAPGASRIEGPVDAIRALILSLDAEQGPRRPCEISPCFATSAVQFWDHAGPCETGWRGCADRPNPPH